MFSVLGYNNNKSIYNSIGTRNSLCTLSSAREYSSTSNSSNATTSTTINNNSLFIDQLLKPIYNTNTNTFFTRKSSQSEQIHDTKGKLDIINSSSDESSSDSESDGSDTDSEITEVKQGSNSINEKRIGNVGFSPSLLFSQNFKIDQNTFKYNDGFDVIIHLVIAFANDKINKTTFKSLILQFIGSEQQVNELIYRIENNLISTPEIPFNFNLSELLSKANQLIEIKKQKKQQQHQ